MKIDRDAALSGAVAAAAAPASQTLVRGLELLEQVAGGPVPLAELAGKLGLSRSTVHRLATTLLERRYLNLLPRRGYTLGPKLLELGTQARGQIDLVRLAEPALEALAAATGDVALLGVRDGEYVVVADRAGGRRALAPSIRPGARAPLTATALGLALLLDDPAQALSAAWHHVHERGEAGFLARMHAAAAAGVVTDLGLADPQICEVAAPVRDAQGQIRAGVAIAVATAYCAPDALAAAQHAVLDAAARIAAELGWHTGRSAREVEPAARSLLNKAAPARIISQNTAVDNVPPPSQPANLPANGATVSQCRDPAGADVERFAMKGRPA